MNKKLSNNAEKRLSRKKIEERYDGEWALLGDPDLDRQERVKRAEILAHSPDKAMVVRAGLNLRRKSVALLWMGRRPRLAVILWKPASHRITMS
jgi:hypothetical protein